MARAAAPGRPATATGSLWAAPPPPPNYVHARYWTRVFQSHPYLIGHHKTGKYICVLFYAELCIILEKALCILVSI